MKKLCLAALAAVSLLGCSDTKEEEKTAEKATEKAAEPVRGVLLPRRAGGQRHVRRG